MCLIVAWLLAALRSGGPYPLLAISGEQGSAKTVLSKLLKALIDPNAAPVRALLARRTRADDCSQNGYLLAFDNLSGLPVWLSDALCRLASGGSFAVRQLYTDVEEVLFEAARPVLLNGIEDVISRPDLGDRAIFLTLSPIGEAQRRPEADLWREFEIARPRILGALLDAVVHGLRAQGRVQLDRLPRMADFALWASACETALWPARHFRPRLHGKPQSRHREHHRSGPRRQPPARTHGRADKVDRERLRPLRLRRVRTSISERTSMGQKSAGARRSIAARADVPAHPGHRDRVLSRRPGRDKNDQAEHDCGRDRQ